MRDSNVATLPIEDAGCDVYRGGSALCMFADRSGILIFECGLSPCLRNEQSKTNRAYEVIKRIKESSASRRCVDFSVWRRQATTTS